MQLQPPHTRDVYSATALKLARQDQRIEGLPLQPLDAPVLTSSPEVPATKEAWANLRAQFRHQDRLIAEHRKVSAKLEEMGAAHETERNNRILSWTKWVSGSLLSVGGLIALFVFFPFALPLAGRFLAWIVAKLPSLAGALGVVGTQAFDSVVRGIERARESASGGEFLNNQSSGVAPAVSIAEGTSRRHSVASESPLALSLSRSMDAHHKALVRSRKHALALA